MQHLLPNTTLKGGQYRIERVLGQGGFGNTYVGVNTVFNERIAIKEFFMQGINDRDDATGSITISIERNKQQFQEQLEKFKKEALRIRKLNNPHIVKVHDLFEENGTAYYVMDFVEGENLAQRLKRTGKPMGERKVRELLPQLLDALKAVHDAGMWHLDIKPANIMLDKNGNVKLIDFGASKQLNAKKGGVTTSTAISYTNGYAPREQMEQNYDKFGPWTDIYALGATLYNLLTNKRPPLPTDIDDDMSEDKHEALPFPYRVSVEIKAFVLMMLNTNRLQRPQSIDDVISEMKNKGLETQQTPEQQLISNNTFNYVYEKNDSLLQDENTIIEKKPKSRPSHGPEDNFNAQNDINYQSKRKGNITYKRRYGFIVLGLLIITFLFWGVIKLINNSESINETADKEKTIENLQAEASRLNTEVAKSKREAADAKLEAAAEQENAAERARTEAEQKAKEAAQQAHDLAAEQENAAERARTEAEQKAKEAAQQAHDLAERLKGVVTCLQMVKTKPEGAERIKIRNNIINELKTLSEKDSRHNKNIYNDVIIQLGSPISKLPPSESGDHYDRLISEIKKLIK